MTNRATWERTAMERLHGSFADRRQRERRIAVGAALVEQRKAERRKVTRRLVDWKARYDGALTE